MKTTTIPLIQKDFDWVKMTPALMKKTADAYLEHKKITYKEIKDILPENRTYLNTLYALERCDDKFESFFSKMGLLSEVSTKKEIRDKAHEVATDLSEKLVDIEYDRDLFISLCEYYEGNFPDEKKSLRKEDIKLLEETLREYRRMGFDLPTEKQKRLKVLMKKVSKLSIAFRQNINDYQDYILCTQEELCGLSERFISTLPKHTDGRYIVSLQYPHIGPFMGEADNRDKRKELAEKNLKKGGVKNLKVIEEIVKLRHEIATILEYKHHADFRTENRMAKSGKNAEDFQNSLLKTLVPLAKKDREVLSAHAKTLGIKKLEHYDIGYVATHLKKKMYDLDPETVRAYFPLDHVRQEMFKLCENLFSISIKEIPAKLWHKDVKMYQINDKGESKGALIGYFAMDLFPREGKFGHACMVDVVVSHEMEYKTEEYLAPFSTMICNFPTPTKKVPSLLSISEVETIFHEFGHLLHMTLTRARLESQAGASVAWDFVETPSQIMENWVWDKEVMSKLSKHYVTGKRIPSAMIERIIKGKTFQNAYFYTRQLIQGKLDLDLHTGKVKDASAAYRKMNKLYFNIVLPEKETLFPAGFGHLVGYDAGYYSYLWALVYACDAFESFKTKGNKNVMTNKEVGMRWRKEVLEKGSSEDEMKLIKNFLGRVPNQKAFLKEVIGK
ncbi:Zn-dependent oligopeptidase [Candidatus Gracilibacteria bacterium]|nr:Zn-dependent oligopeptidase [Candidatus Gracilibacteria bacterium]